MIRQPATWIRAEWVAMDGVGKTLETAAAEVFETAGIALAAGLARIAQFPQKGALLVKLGQGSPGKVADGDRHAPAGVNVTVGHNRQESVPRCAAIGLAASDEELQRAMRGNFSVVPGCFEFLAGFLDQLAILFCFRRRKNRLVQRGTRAGGNQAIGPDAVHFKFAGEAGDLPEFPEVLAMGGERDERPHTSSAEDPNGFHHPGVVAMPPDGIVGFRTALDAHLDETRF